MTPEVKLSTAVAKELEDYLEYHMSNCIISLTSEEELPDDWYSFGIFCGCFTCESREWLMATFSFLRKKGYVDIFVEDEPEFTNDELF
jgi:hypothetical protein